MRRTVILGAAIWIASIHLLPAQPFDRDRLDSLFNRIEAHDRGMGSLSIFDDDGEVYRNSMGFASVEEGIRASEATRYRIGSISKTFTAAIVMQLIEEGKLSTDRTLDRWFPRIPNAEIITIGHLLRHRSGIFNFTQSASYPDWMEEPASEKELVRRIADMGSAFEPGEKTGYSNSNYVLLTLIIQDVEGKGYPAVLKERIVDPCQLEDTYYGGSIDPDQNEAISYTMDNHWIPSTETHPSIPLGAGGIVSTPTDLNRFLTCLFQGGIVSPESLEKMRAIREGMGIGLFRVPFYDRIAYGHTGGIDGFQANAFYFPEEKVSVSYAANGVVMPVNDVMIGVLSIYFGREYDLPEFALAYPVDPDDLEAYQGVYSSPSFPLKITITKKGSTLFGQASGQPSFPLEPTDLHTFSYKQAGLEMVFIPEDSKMIFRQAGAEFTLNREE